MMPRQLWSLAVCWTCVLLYGRAFGEPPRVTVFDADGQMTSGPLRDWSPEALRLSTPQDRAWSWRDVVSVRFDDRPLPSAPRGSVVWLANGDRLIARALNITDERLQTSWRLLDSSETSLPLETVRGVGLVVPHAQGPQDDLAAWVLDRREPRDELRLLNGDRASGELSSWTEQSLTLATAAKELDIREEEVRAIGFNGDLISLPEAKGLKWLVELTDGSRVTLSADNSRFADDAIFAPHVFGTAWRIPIAAVCELRVLGGRAAYLSDLKPTHSEQTPFLPSVRPWPLKQDRSVISGPLRLGGREFAKGLGTHSHSVVSFSIRPQDRYFTARVGLDDATSGDGTATCAVAVDGRVVFSAERISRASGAIPLPLIELSNGKQLTLTVDYGELGDSQDHVNWCDAVLLTRPQ